MNAHKHHRTPTDETGNEARQARHQASATCGNTLAQPCRGTWHTVPMDLFGDPDSDDNPDELWPGPDSDLLNTGPDWQLNACMDFPRDRWIGYVEGYRKAAAVVVDHVAATGIDQDYLVYPFLMCWRHHVELQLKSLYLHLRRWQKQPEEILRTHKINVLWAQVRPLLDSAYPGENSDIDHVDRILKQLQMFDPSSEHFRYPVLKDGSYTLETLGRVHMRSFHQTMEGVARLLDSADTGLRVRIDQRDEYERAMMDF